MKSFKIGDWIYVVNQNHKWFGEMMRITDIEKSVIFEAPKYRVSSKSGISSTYLLESEISFSPPGEKIFSGHEGHQIVKNHALGKEFFYCRKCRVEVV